MNVISPLIVVERQGEIKRGRLKAVKRGRGSVK
jgi:hypothetical protein